MSSHPLRWFSASSSGRPEWVSVTWVPPPFSSWVAVTVFGISVVLLFQECFEGIQFLVPELFVPGGPAGDLAQRRRPQLQVVLAAVAAAPQEAGSLQDLQMLRHRVQRHGEPS